MPTSKNKMKSLIKKHCSLEPELKQIRKEIHDDLSKAIQKPSPGEFIEKLMFYTGADDNESLARTHLLRLLPKNTPKHLTTEELCKIIYLNKNTSKLFTSQEFKGKSILSGMLWFIFWNVLNNLVLNAFFLKDRKMTTQADVNPHLNPERNMGEKIQDTVTIFRMRKAIGFSALTLLMEQKKCSGLLPVTEANWGKCIRQLNRKLRDQQTVNASHELQLMNNIKEFIDAAVADNNFVTNWLTIKEFVSTHDPNLVSTIQQKTDQRVRVLDGTSKLIALILALTVGNARKKTDVFLERIVNTKSKKYTKKKWGGGNHTSLIHTLKTKTIAELLTICDTLGFEKKKIRASCLTKDECIAVIVNEYERFSTFLKVNQVVYYRGNTDAYKIIAINNNIIPPSVTIQKGDAVIDTEVCILCPIHEYQLSRNTFTDASFSETLSTAFKVGISAATLSALLYSVILVLKKNATVRRKLHYSRKKKYSAKMVHYERVLS